MPVPLSFVAGVYKVDGVLLPEAHLWYTLQSIQQAENFDTAVATQSMEAFAGTMGGRWVYFALRILALENAFLFMFYVFLL